MLHRDIELPLFQTMDTELGLKYLNGNKALYLKILNNFLDRYGNLNVDTLDKEGLKDALHTLKGLSATLGMVGLNRVTEMLYNDRCDETFLDLKVELKRVLCELKSSDLVPKPKQRKKVILILNDNPEEIGELIGCLDDAYDLLVALDYEGAVEIMSSENIDLILLNEALKEEGEYTIYELLEKSHQLEHTKIIFSIEELDEVV